MNGPYPGTCPRFRAKRQLWHAAVVSPPAPPPAGEGSVVSRFATFTLIEIEPDAQLTAVWPTMTSYASAAGSGLASQ